MTLRVKIESYERTLITFSDRKVSVSAETECSEIYVFSVLTEYSVHFAKQIGELRKQQ